MSRIPWLSWAPKAVFGSLMFIAALSSVVVFTTEVSASIESQFGATGLFDEADVLSEDERAEIEAAIAEVEAEGAPTVVYLRLLSSQNDRAVDDARSLMRAWNLESELGARDGFVILLNLEPEDPNRGELGVVAGELHFNGGALPQSRLDNIRDEMIDYLADDEMANGIVHGLELTSEYLESGPPEPSAFETFLESIARGPLSILNAFSLVAAMFLGLIGWRTWRDRPRAENVARIKSTEPPANLHPAIA
ncbi:MAG: TPM domain-containing protein, partial [Thermomicrobiaceae bacterium]